MSTIVNVYFDDEFNRISDFSLEKNVIGSFTIYKDSYVNEKYTTAGTSFNTPGKYTIRDDSHTYTVNLKERGTHWKLMST